MSRHIDSTAVYIVALLILAFWIASALAVETQDVFKSLDRDNAEDGLCPFENQMRMCLKVLLADYPNFIYYVIYNKRAVGGEMVWAPIVVKKCSLDFSLQENIWKSIDGENPDIPTKKQDEWNV